MKNQFLVSSLAIRRFRKLSIIHCTYLQKYLGRDTHIQNTLNTLTVQLSKSNTLHRILFILV